MKETIDQYSDKGSRLSVGLHPEQEYVPVKIVGHSLHGVSFFKFVSRECHPLANSRDSLQRLIGHDAASLVAFDTAYMRILTRHLLQDSW